ncbi:MAG TPA: hypothetical protein ENK28_11550 [Aliiroseovarius sp.]|nr:hypothetical protein [Aliiroseovarius sp.]
MMVPRHIAGSLVALTVLGACARHDQGDVRAVLDRWFSLGEAQYFYSSSACSAAMYPVRGGGAKSALQIDTGIRPALAALARRGEMAVAISGQNPDQTFLDIMNADRPTGVAIQAAALGARHCMDDATEGAFHAALSNADALFVWHGGERAVVVFDPGQKAVFWASSDGG